MLPMFSHHVCTKWFEWMFQQWRLPFLHNGVRCKRLFGIHHVQVDPIQVRVLDLRKSCSRCSLKLHGKCSLCYMANFHICLHITSVVKPWDGEDNEDQDEPFIAWCQPASGSHQGTQHPHDWHEPRRKWSCFPPQKVHGHHDHLLHDRSFKKWLCTHAKVYHGINIWIYAYIYITYKIYSAWMCMQMAI